MREYAGALVVDYHQQFSEVERMTLTQFVAWCAILGARNKAKAKAQQLARP